MILSDLRAYLKQQQRVSMADLVAHFHADAEALRGMLALLINKGYVHLMPLSSQCGTSCCQCDPLLTELYEWLNK